MHRTFPDSTILLIDRDAETNTQLQVSLSESFKTVETSTSLAAAVDLLSVSNYTLIVCELGLIETNQPACPMATALLEHQGSIILQSAQQHAAVKFQRFSGQSFYCLKKSVCSDLIPVIASLASRIARRTPQTQWFINPAHFVLPLSSENPTVNSNIHSMY